MAEPLSPALDLSSLQAELHDGQRLYRLAGSAAVDRLHVEAWSMREGVSALAEMRLVCLSLDAALELKQFVGESLTLQTVLADGSLATRSGLVRASESLGADGGLARYRFTLVPWWWLGTQRGTSRVFQDCTVRDIIDEVLGAYSGQGQWQYGDDVGPFLAAAPRRHYLTQYRESDYDFLARLFAEEGLGWRFEEDEAAPFGHRMVIFADSPRLPDSAASPARFHRKGAQEQADAVQALARCTRQAVGQVTLSAWNVDGKNLLTASAPALYAQAGKRNRPVEYDDVLGLEDRSRGWQDTRTVERYARMLMEAAEARTDLIQGRSTLRHLTAGTMLDVDDAPALGLPAAPRMLIDAIEHVGINNLPVGTRDRIDARLGNAAEHLSFDDPPAAVTAEPDIFGLLPAGSAPGATDTGAQPDARTLQSARQTGYANHFRGLHADRPWRAPVAAAQGTRLHARPVIGGVHSAIVVGPQGERNAGSDELYCNARGDVRVRFHWQGDDGGPGNRSTRWVRVAQRQAGPGMGWQWLPRIGQEVLVKFTDGDPDQPIVVGAVYNGRGAGGLANTPGGEAAESDTSAFADATDTAPSAQRNLAGGQGGGHAPVWHGASGAPDGHRNESALWGFKSKEFGGIGYNQLVFDDSDQQLRVQVASSTAETQLNLGHVIHQQDNYRGSFRGQGFELRTDGYTALRGGRGVLLSTYYGSGAAKPEPAGDFAGGMALAKQLNELSRTLNDATTTHQGVKLAGFVGADSADVSTLDDSKAPTPGWLRSVSTTVANTSYDDAVADAEAKNESTGEDKVPHSADAVVAIAGRGGITAIAGQHIQLLTGETTTLASGNDVNLVAVQSLRVHSGQAIGVLAAASQADHQGEGLSLTSSEAKLDVQAQQDTLSVQAKESLSLASSTQNLEMAAAKRVRLATAQGASVVIEGGNITFECPGVITYHAAQRLLAGPTFLSREMNAWPAVKFDKTVVLKYHTGEPAPNRQFEIQREDGAILRGVSDANGRTDIQKSQLVGQFIISIID